jgi:hypothetical protein
VPGGFSWVVTDNSTNCVATVVAGNWLKSEIGYDLPAGCANKDWTTLQNQTVFLPIFDATNGREGSNAEYKVTKGWRHSQSPATASPNPFNGNGKTKSAPTTTRGSQNSGHRGWVLTRIAL